MCTLRNAVQGEIIAWSAMFRSGIAMAASVFSTNLITYSFLMAFRLRGQWDMIKVDKGFIVIRIQKRANKYRSGIIRKQIRGILQVLIETSLVIMSVGEYIGHPLAMIGLHGSYTVGNFLVQGAYPKFQHFPL